MKGKILIAILGIGLITGCTTTQTPEPVIVAEPASIEVEQEATTVANTNPRQKVMTCILALMNMEAHSLDATESCIRVYGEHPQIQRTQREE